MRKIGIEVEGFTPLRCDVLATAIRKKTGIEVRSAGWQMASTNNDAWIITTDGSIRHPVDGSKGKELVSPPLEAEKAREQLSKLLRALRSTKDFGKDQKFSIDKQCSVHIHVDRENMDKDDLRKIYQCYSLIEEDLHLMFPESRRNNKARGGKSFCAPISNLPFEDAFEKREQREMKYYSVQFPAAIPTIEFRIHSASTNPKKIWMWILIIHAIIDYALKLPIVEIWDSNIEKNITVDEVLPKELYMFYLDRCSAVKKKEEKRVTKK